MGAWKTIRITKPCKIKIKNYNLTIEDEENFYKLSLDDTDSIIFEGDRFLVSAKVLSALAKHKVATLFCDENYLPVAIMHPYLQSSLSTDTLKIQIDLSQKLKEKLWQKIIKSKIELQKEVLCYLNKPYEKLNIYFNQVRGLDKYKAEAKGARYYWKQLYDNLKRESDSLDIRNQALNYTYAIVRSLIVRDIAVAGFLPSIGIWHDNRYNPFNLADDLIEPFRPIVDIAVYKIMQKYLEFDFITSAIKKELISILDIEYIEYENGLSSVRNVTKLYVNNFKKAIKLEDENYLTFPKINFKKIDECL